MAAARNLDAAYAPRRAAPGFTLVELLVSIAIITLLTAVLLPVLTKLRTSAQEPACQNNLRQLMIGFRSFAQDHTDQLPGGYWDSRLANDPDVSHRDWLRGDWTQWSSAPAGGTLFGYVSRSPSLYRCPSLTSSAPPASAVTGPGIGSNGHYDYVSMLDLTGARLSAVKPMSQVIYPDGHSENFATPVIVEGDPSLLNGFQFKSWHAASDAMSHTHHGGAFYASIDGSVHWINEPAGGCSIWLSQAPSGKWVSFSPFPFVWGQWNSQ